MTNYPRILIFYQTFNNHTGGGITLSNLFSGWPKEKVGVLSYPFMLKDVSWEICERYYQLGHDEFKWIFPFSLYKQKHFSGPLRFIEKSEKAESTAQPGFTHFVTGNFVNPVIEWFGLHHCISYLRLSPNLKEWLSDYKPELLYLQLSNFESIKFADLLIRYLKIPAVIHMMDDWPSTISNYGPLRKLWRTVIDREFRKLLERTDLHLSISDAMSDEYLRRYNKNFKAFHNPVDTKDYPEHSRENSKPRGNFRILYLGRIGKANINTILFFANHVSKFNGADTEVVFDIFSKDCGIEEIDKIKNIRNVNIYPSVKYELVMSLMRQYDLLFLPLDFSEEGMRFARLSIPTKASEYMFSGTPVLVMAPSESAVLRFFLSNKCGCCVSTQEGAELDKALGSIINNIEYRELISTNAFNTARNKFDGEKVRREFHEMLIKSAGLE